MSLAHDEPVAMRPIGALEIVSEPHHLDQFPYPLPDRRLQTLSQRTLLAHFLANASLQHSVFLLCPKPPAKRFPGFSLKPFQENTPSDFLQESGRNRGRCPGPRPQIIRSHGAAQS